MPRPRALVEDSIYEASVGDLLARLQQVPEATASVMLIGHNPGMEGLALLLAREGPELEELRLKFPTAAMATLGFDGAWADLGPQGASLDAFVRPADLE